jgi:hypothetical protein
MPKVVGEFAQGESGDDVAHVVLRILEMVGGEGEWRFDVDLDVVGLTQLLDALGRWRGGQGSASAVVGGRHVLGLLTRGGGVGGSVVESGVASVPKVDEILGNVCLANCHRAARYTRESLRGGGATNSTSCHLVDGRAALREGREGLEGPEGPEGWGKRKVCAYVEEAKWVVDVMGRCARGNVCVWRGGGGGDVRCTYFVNTCIHIRIIL